MAGVTDRKDISQGEGPARQAISLVMAVQADVAAGGDGDLPPGAACRGCAPPGPQQGLGHGFDQAGGTLGGLGRLWVITCRRQASPSGRFMEVRSTSKTSAWVLEKLITPR